MSVSFPLRHGHHFFTTPEGQTLHYYMEGKGPLLVVPSPGWGIGVDYLRTGLQPLTERFLVAFLTTRGTPPSSRPKTRSEDPDEGRKMMSSADMADDIEALRIYLGNVPELRILGHSNAGTIALHYAVKYPLTVSRLLLVDHRIIRNRHVHPDCETDDADTNEMHAKLLELTKNAEAHPPFTNAEFREQLRKILPHYFVSPAESMPAFWNSINETNLCLWARNAQRDCDVAVEMEMQKKRGNVHGKELVIVEQLEGIFAKVCMIFGAKDAVCTIENAIATQSEIPDAELFVLKDAAHFPWVECGPEFFEIAINFLDHAT